MGINIKQVRKFKKLSRIHIFYQIILQEILLFILLQVPRVSKN